MSNIRRLLTQDDKVREVESLQLFLIFVTKYGVALLQLNPSNLDIKVVIREKRQKNKLKKILLNL